MNIAVTLATIAVILTSSLPSSGQVPASRRSLAGLDSFEVTVEHLLEDATLDGLTSALIEEAVETKLRQAGFTLAPSGSEYLYVNVNMTFGSGIYIYCADLALRQPGRLERNPEIAVPDATTWRTGIVGAIQARELQTGIVSVVLTQIDSFIADYEAENPDVLKANLERREKR